MRPDVSSGGFVDEQIPSVEINQQRNKQKKNGMVIFFNHFVTKILPDKTRLSDPHFGRIEILKFSTDYSRGMTIRKRCIYVSPTMCCTRIAAGSVALGFLENGEILIPRVVA